MVCHGVGPEDFLIVFHLQAPKPKFVPVSVILFLDNHVFVVHLQWRYVDLNVAARLKVEDFSFGEFYYELLDEGGNVVVTNHFALPFLDAKDLFIDMNLHVLFDLDLASEAPVFAGFLAGQVVHFGRQDIAATFEYLAPAHGAGTAATTGRGEENAFL